MGGDLVQPAEERGQSDGYDGEPPFIAPERWPDSFPRGFSGLTTRHL